MKLTTKNESIAEIFQNPRWNHLRTRYAREDAKLLGPQVVIRLRQPGFNTHYNLPIEQLDDVLADLAAKGCDTSRCYFNEAAPDDALVLQGELIGHSLMYTTAKKPMKLGFAEETRYAEGAATEAILRWACNGPSYDDMQELRSRHPDAIIEFGCYSVCLGSQPDRNTIFWEIRESF